MNATPQFVITPLAKSFSAFVDGSFIIVALSV